MERWHQKTWPKAPLLPNMTSNPPQKYIKVNGISKINPDWMKYNGKLSTTEGKSSMTNKELQNALPGKGG